MSKLKPCPFCGGTEFSLLQDHDGEGLIIQCSGFEKCGAGMWMSKDDLPDFDDMANDDGELNLDIEGVAPLFDRWNRRVERRGKE